jgi:hypothetical protein
MDLAHVKQLLAALPGGPPPASSPFSRGSVFNSIKFEELTDDSKCELAKFFILDCCPRIGAFASNGDAGFFLGRFATELNNWPRGQDIASRRLEHVAFAVSNSVSFASPQGALAATYLLHQLEFLFRALSGALTLEGTFVSAAAKTAIEKSLGRQVPSRINDIVDTYEIMRLNTGVLAPRLFSELDGQLPPNAMPGGQVLSNIGERIAHFRHPVSHGPLADPSSEGIFYALLMAIAIYGSSLFRRV